MGRKKKSKKQRPTHLVVLRRGSHSQFRENEPFSIDSRFAGIKAKGDPGYVRIRALNELPLKDGGEYAESEGN